MMSTNLSGYSRLLCTVSLLAALLAGLLNAAPAQAAPSLRGPTPAESARELVDDAQVVAAAQKRAEEMAKSDRNTPAAGLFAVAFLQELHISATVSDLSRPALGRFVQDLTGFQIAAGKKLPSIQRMERSQLLVRDLLDFLYARYLQRPACDSHYLSYWLSGGVIVTNGKEAGRLATRVIIERSESFLKATNSFTPTTNAPSPTPNSPKPTSSPTSAPTPSPSASSISTPTPAAKPITSTQTTTATVAAEPPLQMEEMKVVFRSQGLDSFPEADMKAILVYMRNYNMDPAALAEVLKKVEITAADPEQLRKIIVSHTDNAAFKGIAERADARSLLSFMLTFNLLDREKARKEYVVKEVRTVLGLAGLEVSTEASAALLEAGVKKYRITDPIVEGRLTILYQSLMKFAESLMPKPAR